MVNMGYSRKDIEDTITHQKYDDIQATYLLLGRRTLEVSFVNIINKTTLHTFKICT